jgi:hypothetical protein
MAALKRHQELLRNVFPQMDLPGVLLEIMQLAIEAASGDSEPEMAGCRSHAMHVQLMITIELLLKDFGLVKSMRKKAIALAQSKDKKQRVVGYYILVLTQSPHMLTAWYG